ncbi:MAG: GDP-mannose 4,6-dehydratase, partial [Candidatus Spechtbacterales bacterium]
MAFEVIPLEPDTITKPAVPSVEPYRITLAGRLFQAGNVSIEEAAEIAGIAPAELEAIFMKRGMITRNKILVCGGAGFIGSNFVHYILEKYPYDDVVVYDKLTYAGNLENLRNAERSPRYAFYQGDIADAEYLDEVIRKERPDYIVNFAA